ncbi:MAG: acyl-CoA dehydrogenase family protein, partial [Sphingobium sp.]
MAYTERALEIAARVEDFVRTVVIPYEKDTRRTSHGPSEELAAEFKQKARDAGLMTPHILPDGSHLMHSEVALVLRKSGLSPLGPLALNTAAPDEGNMYLLGKVGSAEQKERFLAPMIAGDARSAFFMTEPAADGGAGSDPSMLKTRAVLDGNHWVINGRKAFIT